MKLIKERVFDSDVYVMIANEGETPLLVAGEYKQVMTVKEAENHWMLNNGYERVGAVNCGFFNMSTKEMLGQCLCDWSNVKMSETGWYDGIADVAYDGSKIVVGDFATFNGMQWVRAVSWGIMKDGKEWTLGREKYSHTNSRQPRTMIGKTKEGYPIVIVVDGRNMKSKLVSGAVSKGVTASQQYQLALRYNCQDLVNADGGGSSVMEYQGNILNNPSDGVLRRCSDFVVFYRKKQPQAVKYYRIVAGSYGKYENAKATLNNLQTKKVDCFIKQVEVNGTKYYRVYCGSYAQKENAVIQQNKLKEIGIDTFLSFE
jgi:hypothetical protein